MSYPPEHSDAEYAALETALWGCYLASGADTDGMSQREFFVAVDEPTDVVVKAVTGLRNDYDEQGESLGGHEAEDARLRGIVRAQARFLRWVADNYKGVDLDIVRARANELDALAARGEAL